MSEYELGPEPDSPAPEPDEPLFDPEPEGGPPPILIGGIALLAVVLLATAFFVMRGCGRPEPAPPAAPASVPATLPAATPEPTPEPPLELPPLEASDELVRQLVAALSSRPELVAWLAEPHLVRTFVVVVENVAEGASPGRTLRFMKPNAPFAAQESRSGARLDPASYARYDAVAAVFASLDAAGSARLYRQLEPLVDAAYVELGFSDRDFDETLARAAQMLVSTPVVLEAAPLTRRVLSWRFVDLELEALPEAQKHLVRMGPDNTRRIQAKVREITQALGLELR